jgi:cephalosporin-C deacetylase-like acetyl esterase
MRDISELLQLPPRARMVPDFVLARAQQLEAAAALRRAERQQVGPEEVESIAARDALRDRVRDAIGIDRLPRVSKSHILDSVERPNYTIVKKTFEVTRGMVVPALLYLPKGRGPHPAVVHAPGHWMEDAKLAQPIQVLNQQLATVGIATLCFDPIGQGERRIGWHQHGQLAPLLVGMTTLGAMVAENIGALELLAGRDDIDSTRLGMIGASGGGFTTLFSSAIDERVSTAVVSSIVNTHVGQIRDAAFGTGWDGWVDLCNQVPGMCTVGNLGDIAGLIAPRSLLIANAEDDPPFPLAGSRQVAEEAAGIYRYQGAENAFRYVEVPGTHGFQANMRAVTVAYLRDALLRTESDVPAESEEAAFEPQWAVPHNLATAAHPQSRFPVDSAGTCLPAPVDSNRPLVQNAIDEAARLRLARPRLTDRSLRDCLGPFPARESLRAHVSNHVILPEFEAQRLSIDPEPGITLDTMVTLPRNWSDELAPVVIIVDEGGKGAAFSSDERACATARGWATVLPDLRGTGESAMSEFEVATASWMIDRDILNQRVWDVIRITDYISDRYSSSQQVDKSKIVIWGRGSFGLVALVAAALDSRLAAAGRDDASTFEDIMTVNSRLSPMLFHYKALLTLGTQELTEYIAPRPVTAGGIESFERWLEEIEECAD